MKNIVVPTDFSANANVAVELAAEVAKKSGGTIHLIHVTEVVAYQYHKLTVFDELVGDPMKSPFVVNMLDVLKKELNALQKQRVHAEVAVHRKVMIGDAYQKIKEYCKEVDADLLIIGAKGVTSQRDLFLGSLTDKIIRSFSIPVLTTKDKLTLDPFRSIVFATDLEAIHTPLLEFLKQWQVLFNPKLLLLKVRTPKQVKSENETRGALERLGQKFALQNFTTHNHPHEDEEYGIVEFAELHQAGIIAMGVHERSGFRRIISGGSMAEKVVDHTQRPVLTLQIQKP